MSDDPVYDDPDYPSRAGRCCEPESMRFVCPHCQAVDHDDDDAREGYCASCKRFAEEGRALR
jgi:hypothetical protein